MRGTLTIGSGLSIELLEPLLNNDNKKYTGVGLFGIINRFIIDRPKCV